MERIPTDLGEPDRHDAGDQVAARLLAQIAAARARLTEEARVIKEIDRTLAAGPQRPGSGRPRDSAPSSGAGSE
ncbi:hypothetical protein TR51_10585 [Kitasatospora griseola]|uniref:Uncharacterized protein n=1 Tax=Kitasatospora griseola TaxID=2064 RepID=A0A0D0PWD5_KITGR|nr:hypothetical protein [Kitasatospora griseola]KIQ64657.1 hypothetical protein TR51_10585 [Kitasatospora griseola]